MVSSYDVIFMDHTMPVMVSAYIDAAITIIGGVFHCTVLYCTVLYSTALYLSRITLLLKILHDLTGESPSAERP